MPQYITIMLLQSVWWTDRNNDLFVIYIHKVYHSGHLYSGHMWENSACEFSSEVIGFTLSQLLMDSILNYHGESFKIEREKKRTKKKKRKKKRSKFIGSKEVYDVFCMKMWCALYKELRTSPVMIYMLKKKNPSVVWFDSSRNYCFLCCKAGTETSPCYFIYLILLGIGLSGYLWVFLLSFFFFHC